VGDALSLSLSLYLYLSLSLCGIYCYLAAEMNHYLSKPL
jgi:hypothetical protein